MTKDKQNRLKQYIKQHNTNFYARTKRARAAWALDEDFVKYITAADKIIKSAGQAVNRLMLADELTAQDQILLQRV